MFTYNRSSLDLNGTWKFCPDPMQRCRRQRWWINKPDQTVMFPCWDKNGLWKIQVPGTWKTQFEELKWYDGHAVYFKEFAVDTIPDDHEAFLVFDGIVYEAEIYLNGHVVTRHEWGYSPFATRVTEMLMPQNELFVLVDNHLKPDRVPGEIFDWNNDGGIINGVKLVFVPKTHIHNFRTQTCLGEDEVNIEFTVELASRDINASESVLVRIPDLTLEKEVMVTVGSPAQVSFTIPNEKIELWSPEKPTLYKVELATDKEAIRDEIGFREIRTEGQDIILNGKPIRLYGASTHAEFKDTGRTATPEGIEMMVNAAKELGLNFLRCAHYPYAELFGRAMDKAGLMWWEEVPAYWLLNMSDEGQTRKACGMMAEAIKRDWNRASIIIWSVSNECCYRNPENHAENNYAYWFKVVPMVRKLDPSRLISCAEAGNMITIKPVWDPASADEFKRSLEEDDHWLPGHADEWYDLFDILAANMYQQPGESLEAYRRFVKMLQAYNKPLMLSEFGSMSLLGADTPADKLGSEERHCQVIKEAYDAFKELPELSGYSPWCITDIRVPIHWRWYNQGKGLFRYGFMDENWQKKKAFNVLRDAIAELKEHFD